MSERPRYAFNGLDAHNRLMRLRLVRKRGLEADQLDVTLSDHDGRLTLPPTGARISVAIGWGTLSNMGEFVIDEIAHQGAPDTLTLRGRSLNLRGGANAKRTHSYHDTTLGEILGVLAGRLDAETRIDEALAEAAIGHLDQTEESDLNLLTRLGERFDAIAVVQQQILAFFPMGQGRTASGVLIPPRTLTRQSGDQHRYLVADRDAWTGVITTWHDSHTAERHDVLVGSDENAKRLRTAYPTEAEAREQAQAEWGRLQRGRATFSYTLARGEPMLIPETPMQLSGFKTDINTTPWIITEVAHDLTDNGFTTQLQLEVRTV